MIRRNFQHHPAGKSKVNSLWRFKNSPPSGTPAKAYTGKAWTWFRSRIPFCEDFMINYCTHYKYGRKFWSGLSQAGTSCELIHHGYHGWHGENHGIINSIQPVSYPCSPRNQWLKLIPVSVTFFKLTDNPWYVNLLYFLTVAVCRFLIYVQPGDTVRLWSVAVFFKYIFWLSSCSPGKDLQIFQYTIFPQKLWGNALRSEKQSIQWGEPGKKSPDNSLRSIKRKRHTLDFVKFCTVP